MEPAFLDHWIKLKSTYNELRGSTLGQTGEQIPSTTYGDVRQLIELWDGKLARIGWRYALLLDPMPELRDDWTARKSVMHEHLSNAPPLGLYPCNEWFWQVAMRSVAIYVSGLEQSWSHSKRCALTIMAGLGAAFLAGASDTDAEQTRSPGGILGDGQAGVDEPANGTRAKQGSGGHGRT